MKPPLTPLQPWIAQKIGCTPETLSRAALDAYQLQKLQETLDRCRERSPFYRRRLAGFPARLHSFADWEGLPFTTAEELQERVSSFVCVSQSEVERVVTLDTSGTTGPAKRLFFTAADQELTRDFFHQGMSTFTEAGDRVLILLPCERPGSVGDLLDQALWRLGARGIRHGPVAGVAETLKVILQEEVTVVVGVPVQVLGLVRSAAARQFPRPHLKSVLLTTDHVPDAIVRAVEAAWRCTVFNHYGMTEMGLGGGVECAAREGYHLREADLYVEVVDPQTGEPVADGQPGEIVFTTLTRQAMPLIRYRTGDMSRFLPGACSCGAILRRLEKVRFRRTGRFALPDGYFLTIADLDEALFGLDGVLDFAATLSAGGLQLAVRAETQEVGAAVRRKLSSLPAIISAGLDVAVSVQPSAVNPAGKRRMAYV